MPPQPPAAPAAGPPPTAEEVERDMQILRARVQARCAALQAATAGAPAAGAEAEEFQASMFKWDRDCEDALYAVLLNSQRMGAACVHSRFCVVAPPMADAAACACSAVCTSWRTRTWSPVAYGRPARWTLRH